MLKIVVYEDNSDNLERVISVIHKVMAPYDFEYKIEKYLVYNEEVEEIINELSSQKIFILDIEMPKVSGLELAAKIREKDWKSIIIFLTSHAEFKNDIFYSRLLAFDYISKFGLYDKRLKESLNKSLQILNKYRVLTFKYNYISYRIDFDEILYIKRVSNDNRNIIYMENGSNVEIGGTIKNIVCKLDQLFCMINQSCIVNIDKIYNIDVSSNTVRLKNKEVIGKISIKYKKILLEKFENR